MFHLLLLLLFCIGQSSGQPLEISTPYKGIRCSDNAEKHNHFLRLASIRDMKHFAYCKSSIAYSGVTNAYIEFRVTVHDDFLTEEEFELSIEFWDRRRNITFQFLPSDIFVYVDGVQEAYREHENVMDETEEGWSPMDTSWFQFQIKNNILSMWVIGPRNSKRHILKSIPIDTKYKFNPHIRFFSRSSESNVDIMRVLMNQEREPWKQDKKSDIEKRIDGLSEIMEYVLRTYSTKINVTLQRVEKRLQILEVKTQNKVSWTYTWLWLLFVVIVVAVTVAWKKYKKMMKVHFI